jgi:diguanylate cyclase (GGDEF)-like protein
MNRSLLEGARGTTLSHLLALEFERHPQAPLVVSLAFIDLDDFSGFNERYGRQSGDRVLSQIEQTLTAIAVGGVAGSFGGDEFALLLTGIDDTDAIKIAQDALKRIAVAPRAQRICGEIVRASIGGATSSGRPTATAMIGAAHDALASAKRAGGNTIVWGTIAGRIGGSPRRPDRTNP